MMELCSIYSLTGKMRILDFGCGTGDLLLRLFEIMSNAECIGIDISSNAINIANTRKSGKKLEEEKKKPGVSFYARRSAHRFGGRGERKLHVPLQEQLQFRSARSVVQHVLGTWQPLAKVCQVLERLLYYGPWT